MGGSKTTIQQPDPIDPSKAMGEYLFGKNFGAYRGVTDPRLQEKLIRAEERYRPRYTALELQDIATMARGRGGTPGLFDLLEEQSTRAGELQREQLGLQREADVAALQEFAPQVVEAYREADPYSTELAEAMSAEAMRGPSEAEQLLGERGLELAASTGELTPLEARRAQQSARAASAARGRGLDQSALYGEMQSRMAEEMGKREREVALGSQLLRQQAGLQQQRFGQLGGALGAQRQLAGDVGMTILGRPSAAIGLGGQMLGQAQAGAAGPMGPQLFDPNVGINMAMQQRAQDINLMGAQAQASASRSSGRSSMFGSIAGAMIGLCWVAREVYGVDNPKWLQFREWMLEDSPSWFRSLYIKYGERFAKFISNKPLLKTIIRKWMNTRIK
jgi:hypothetical protein